jgi:hypothetical protein
MKIEMGESLIYSWLRHVKKCQVVQTNWTPSSKWNRTNEAELEQMVKEFGEIFSVKYGLNAFKHVSLSKIMQQAEADAIGISFTEIGWLIYGVDVAFHKDGLLYGDGKETTITAVIKKCLRTAICLRGYFGADKAEIIFASPKISKPTRDDLIRYIDEINDFFMSYELRYKFSIIANEEFNELILQPVLAVSKDVNDSSELFLRSYQLLQMFEDKVPCTTKK